MKLSWSNSLLVAPTFISGVKITKCTWALAQNFLVVKTRNQSGTIVHDLRAETI